MFPPVGAVLIPDQPMAGACRATGVDSTVAGQGGSCSIALVHHFHAEPARFTMSAQVFTALAVQDGLVEVETVQVEGHG